MSSEQFATLAIVSAVFFGLPAVGLALLLWREFTTLRNRVPDDHVTAVLRLVFRRQPGVVTLVLVLWAFIFGAVVFGVAAHAWWT